MDWVHEAQFSNKTCMDKNWGFLFRPPWYPFVLKTVIWEFPPNELKLKKCPSKIISRIFPEAWETLRGFKMNCSKNLCNTSVGLSARANRNLTRFIIYLPLRIVIVKENIKYVSFI